RLHGARGAGVVLATGVPQEQPTWTVATSAGMAALLVASERVFRAVRYGGALYLAFLGLQALRMAARRDGESDGALSVETAPTLSPPVALRQGLVSNLTNPKMIAFFPALLPQ